MLCSPNPEPAMYPTQNAHAAVFATTHWTVVMQAGRADSPEAGRALAELCRAYWYPLYAHARRQGFDFHTAQDLTQSFFGKLLEKNYLQLADRRRGKFRWFLLTAFKCFLANEWDRVRAQKRGGGQTPISLDGLTAEQRYSLEPVDALSADQLYDRRWALDLLERVRTRLKQEYANSRKHARFEQFEQYLPGGEPSAIYSETARRAGLTDAAVRQEAHRMKKRFGELLRSEIAQTVAHPDEIDDEIRYLIDVVCRR
jgi:DNA-directed RNA polymerase specialized sigma24 family protein